MLGMTDEVQSTCGMVKSARVAAPPLRPGAGETSLICASKILQVRLPDFPALWILNQGGPFRLKGVRAMLNASEKGCHLRESGWRST
jgi:hypothetical protein